MSIKNFVNFLKTNLTNIIIVFLIVALGIGIFQITKKEYSYKIYRENVELLYDGARADLVTSIDSVIRIVAPSTCMNGLAILKACEEYDIDLFFVLAQGQLESHFGTKGMAAKTNSVFNVFAYDGHSYEKISKNGKYKHPDLSLEPYMKLLKSRYLVDGKTEKDLMIKYVDCNGKRYASDKNYEDSLIGIYNKYITCKPLQGGYNTYLKYKILSGKH